MSPRRSVHYPVTERPRVLVRHGDGRWYPGRLHAWLPDLPATQDHPDGPVWHAVVSYHVGTGRQYYLCVPADLVQRSDEEEGAVDSH